jgi:phage gp36-like protein
MTYATLAQMIQRYGSDMLISLTDRTEVPSGLVDAALVEKALEDAAAMIDGHLAAKYQLPLSVVPAFLPKIAQAIAIWDLHVFEADPKIAKDYENARKDLRDIGSGVLRIPGAAGVEPQVTGGSGARITDRERPLTAENMKGFI